MEKVPGVDGHGSDVNNIGAAGGFKKDGVKFERRSGGMKGFFDDGTYSDEEVKRVRDSICQNISNDIQKQLEKQRETMKKLKKDLTDEG